MGYKQYKVTRRPYGETPIPVMRTNDFEVENDQYIVSVRPADGVVTGIVDKETGKQLVAPATGKGWNELMRWTLLNEQTMALGIAQVRIESGPVASHMFISRTGSLWPLTRISLYTGTDRIEFVNTLDRSKMPFVAQTGLADYYSFLFPFNYMETPEILIENSAGFHRWPDDYLPGARLDGAAPQHVLSFFGNNGDISLQSNLSFRETFFAHLPAFPVDGRRVLYNNTVRASVMRKFDQGVTSDFGAMNFPSVEPGLKFADVYAFAVSSSEESAFDPCSATKLGWEFNSPLIAAVLPPDASAKYPEYSFWSLDKENVVILTFKPDQFAPRGQYILRLQEIAGQPTAVTLTSAYSIKMASKVSMTENETFGQVGIDPLTVSLGPYETCTLRLLIDTGN